MEVNKIQIEKLIDKFFPIGEKIIAILDRDEVQLKVLSIDFQDNYTIKLKALKNDCYHYKGEILDYHLICFDDGEYSWRHRCEPSMWVYFEHDCFPDGFGIGD
jgi:hypothetical protein